VVSSDSHHIVIGLKVALVVASKPNIVTLTSRQIYVNIKIPSKSVSALVLESTATTIAPESLHLLSNTFP
jgi:hypothetical protein